MPILSLKSKIWDLQFSQKSSDDSRYSAPSTGKFI
jgi:hypothetical protein